MARIGRAQVHGERIRTAWHALTPLIQACYESLGPGISLAYALHMLNA
jgi:hypothetical protein